MIADQIPIIMITDKINPLISFSEFPVDEQDEPEVADTVPDFVKYIQELPFER